MTHDPLCLSLKAPDGYWPEELCNCKLIESIRADEREKMPSCTFDCHECRVMDFFGIGIDDE